MIPLERAERLAARAAERGLDAVAVTNLVDVRWLTGFTGSNAVAVVGPNLRRFLTDFRYVTQAADQLDPAWERTEPANDLLEALAAGLRRPMRLGFDDADLTVRSHRRLLELLPDGVEAVAAGGLVGELRQTKDADELRRIAAAAQLADVAFRRVVERGIVGRTEREVALDLEVEMRRAGADGPSFPPIVAAAGHGALPHAEPRDVPIPPDTLVVVDWGARLHGYCSDCTRTLATGTVDEDMASVYGLVLEAQEAALRAVAPGPTGREVDAVARERIEAGGHGERFGHGLGHGVGLEVHEAPRLSRQGDTPLQAGHVVTVEPGVYVPGRFGVRIEDLVAVTQDGAPDVFSGIDKGLTVVG